MSITNSGNPQKWSLQSFSYPVQEVQRQASLALQKTQHFLPPFLQKQSDQVQQAAVVAIGVASTLALFSLTRSACKFLTRSKEDKPGQQTSDLILMQPNPPAESPQKPRREEEATQDPDTSLTSTPLQEPKGGESSSNSSQKREREENQTETDAHSAQTIPHRKRNRRKHLQPAQGDPTLTR